MFEETGLCEFKLCFAQTVEPNRSLQIKSFARFVGQT